MLNVVYLVIFVLGNNGVTSQAIPQANMQQCQINARIYNTGKDNGILPSGYSSSVSTQSAQCIAGVMPKWLNSIWTTTPISNQKK